MSVGISIILKAFKFLTLFVALGRTIDAGVTSGGFQESDPQLKQQKYKKNFKHLKFTSITGARATVLLDQT